MFLPPSSFFILNFLTLSHWHSYASQTETNRPLDTALSTTKSYFLKRDTGQNVKKPCQDVAGILCTQVFQWYQERILSWSYTVHSLYSGHRRDLELVSSLAGVRDRGSLLQSKNYNLFVPGIQLLSVLSWCPLQRGVVRKARVDCITELECKMALIRYLKQLACNHQKMQPSQQNNYSFLNCIHVNLI